MNFSQKNIDHLQSRLIEWYKKNHRPLPWRQTRDPYRIWVSEVMLQQTQVQTVVPYYQEFIQRFPTVETLAKADLQQVLKQWEGLGYYGRARNLHRASQEILTRHGGQFPEAHDEIKKLPGVGDYIAAALSSIAFNTPFAVVDGNVKRVLSRLFEIDTPINKNGVNRYFGRMAEGLLERRQPGTYNQAIMELGALICRPKAPECTQCPISPMCQALGNGTVGQYPKRIRAARLPEYKIAIGVVFKKDKVLITKRRPKGLLGGLWEFPGGKINSQESPKTACIREIKEETGLTVTVTEPLSQIKHAYTHFKIVAHVFVCRYVTGRVRLQGPEDYRWIRIDEIDNYPFPGANHKFIPLIRKWDPKRVESKGIPT